VGSPDQVAWDEQVSMVKQLYKPDVWEILSPELVLSFWSLSYADIYFPKAKYDPRLFISLSYTPALH
jgi:hypothetical protein